MAIPGGRSPGPILRGLASILSERTRRNLYLFWVDERAVPVGHGDRNDAATLAFWEKGGPLPAHIYPMPAENKDLKQAAADYSRTLERNIGKERMDICLLGVGEDGHIASLFPRHRALERKEPVVAVYDSPKPPSHRLTLTLPVLNRSRLRIILAPGKEKGLIYQRAGTRADSKVPASLLIDDRTIWFIDNPV